MYTPDIAEADVFAALRTFLLKIVPDCTEVIRLLDNRVPMPQCDSFITMRQIAFTRLATNISTYTAGLTSADDVKNVMQEGRFDIQVTCFGPGSAERAITISTLMRDAFAVESFPVNITPLYADEPRQMDFTTAEMQYLEQWIVPVSIQYNPTVQVPVQLANTISIGTITNV